MSASKSSSPLESFKRFMLQTWIRARLWLEKRKLRKAEAELGMLGWQQADFFSDDINAQLNNLHEIEQAEVELMNEEADLGEQVSQLAARHEEENKALLARLSEFEAQRKTHGDALAAESLRMAELQKVASRFDTAVSDLERRTSDLMEAEKAHGDSFLHEERVAFLKIQSERLGLKTELDDLRSRRDAEMPRVQAMKASCSALQTELENFDVIVQGLRDDLATAERIFKTREKEILRRKKQTAKARSDFESKKFDPYLLIGRCLADAEIAPMNQPESLQRVLDRRQVIAKIEADLNSNV